MDADDHETIERTEGYHRVVNEPLEGRVTSVRNWNAAAAASTADVLVVVADDLFPPQGWDTALRSVIGRLDPRQTAFAIKVTDDPERGDALMRHPVVSRAFYEEFGLFAPQFDGVCCDDDITRRAFWRSVIVDGRELVLDHRHPTLVAGTVGSESHERINAPSEYAKGHAILESLWTRRQRIVRVRLAPAWLTQLGAPGLAAGGWGLRLVAQLEWLARLARAASRRVTSPR
jgi:hypothetical protein